MAVPILMYHSISDTGPGPVSLPRAVFRDQLTVLADAGARVATVSEYVAARRDGRPLPPGTVVLTFDDAYRDFVDHALPELNRHNWQATVFVPVSPIDANQPWDCGDGHRRPLLSWPAIAELAAKGIEMGAHSMSHTDLTKLPVDAARREIVESRDRLQTQIGRAVTGFAPPFGRITPALRDGLSAHFRWSVSARMGRAATRSNLYDLPRIEMWYFRRISRWRRYVARGWTPYFSLRAALRAARKSV